MINASNVRVDQKTAEYISPSSELFYKLATIAKTITADMEEI